MKYDVAVVGAGIVGAAVAATLSRCYRVLLLEAEAQPGYHSTGRSVSIYDRAYGNATVRALTASSYSCFDALMHRIPDDPVLLPRGVIYIATAEQEDRLERKVEATSVFAPDVVRRDGAFAERLVPILKQGKITTCMHEPEAAEINVATLHQGFLRDLRERGGELALATKVSGLWHAQGVWHLDVAGESIRADRVINAAGAWADEIALAAGGTGLGLVPKRRTVCTVPIDAAYDHAPWPFVVDADERFYFKHETGRLLVSPADETPCAPSDAQADDYDVAVAVDRLENVTTLVVERVMTRWAGLRSFFADGSPAIGADPALPSFYWAAGLGGFGIQTAPAVAECLASLLTGSDWPRLLLEHGVDPGRLAPARLAGACRNAGNT